MTKNKSKKEKEGGISLGVIGALGLSDGQLDEKECKTFSLCVAALQDYMHKADENTEILVSEQKDVILQIPVSHFIPVCGKTKEEVSEQIDKLCKEYIRVEDPNTKVTFVTPMLSGWEHGEEDGFTVTVPNILLPYVCGIEGLFILGNRNII